MQPIARYAAQFLTGTAKTTGGKEVVDRNRGETMLRFLRSKVKPSVGMGIDVTFGETATGEDLRPSITTAMDLFLRSVTPLIAQDIEKGVSMEQLINPTDPWAIARAVALGGPTAALGGSFGSYDTPENRIPGMDVYTRREEIVAEKLGVGEKDKKLLVEYFREGGPNGDALKRESLRKQIDNEELLSKYTRTITALENELKTKYPDLLTNLQEQGFALRFEPKEEKAQELPYYPAGPKKPNDKITTDYAKDQLAKIYGKKWGNEPPKGEDYLPYNLLPTAQKKAIDEFVKKLDAATAKVYGPKEKIDRWAALQLPARQYIARKVVEQFGEPQVQEEESVEPIVAEILSEIKEP
jgi:hypothetical protein